jgi:hypothetical protein
MTRFMLSSLNRFDDLRHIQPLESLLELTCAEPLTQITEEIGIKPALIGIFQGYCQPF